MKVWGISVVRSQVSGQVDIAATLAAYVLDAEEKMQKAYLEFQAALSNKLAGGKDNEDMIADLLVKFFSQPMYKGAVNSVTVPRKFVLDWVAPKLIEAGLYTTTDEKKGTTIQYAEAREAVEKFIFDNADTEAAPRDDAWFRVTTGKGRGAGLVTERRRPIPEDLTVDPTTIPGANLETPEAAPANPLDALPVNLETLAQVEAAAEALGEIA